ncbi:MAG: hypothetical protein KY410_05190, partial [Proteobacteria bacterium]|nr:hypothetical protein [Pseudomonadota bacterium]
LRFFEKPHCFEEFPLDAFPAARTVDALAIVRDEHVWSLLVPAQDNAVERFGLFSFHFAPGLDNSGFVGWLASHLKTVLGTGVFVVCGQNSGRGGIFDYWGVPESVTERAAIEVENLRAAGRNL